MQTGLSNYNALMTGLHQDTLTKGMHQNTLMIGLRQDSYTSKAHRFHKYKRLIQKESQELQSKNPAGRIPDSDPFDIDVKGYLSDYFMP